MKQQYRIVIWRQGTTEEVYLAFEREGETLEKCDEQARKLFHSESNKSENVCEGMAIVRIDVRAVAEKITFIGKNGRQECDPE